MSSSGGEEVVFSCSHGAGGRSMKISAWAPSKGAVQRTYSCEAQGGGAALALLGKTYLLCALKNLPFIYVWHLRKEQVYMKVACPGVVRTLAVTPDGVYCAAGVAEKIHVWQVCTGRLLAVESQHYQTVTVLVFTDDGLWLISGGEDGRVLVWSLRQVLADAFDSSGITLPHSGGVARPTGPHPPMIHQTWSDHTLPVTAVHCGAGGLQARVATASLDQTCKLYELASGHLLCSLLFGFSLTAVTMDMAEQWLFVGGASGRIAQVNLFLQRTSPSHNTSVNDVLDEGFKGHTKAVTSLAVSLNGLVSSSEDGTCHVWDIDSGQTTRLLHMRGAVADSLLCWDVVLPGTGKKTRSGLGPGVSITPFQKQLWYTKEGVTGREDVQLTLRRTVDPLCDLASLDCEAGLSLDLPAEGSGEGEMEEVMEVHRLREELTQLRDINRTLYIQLSESLSSPVTTRTLTPHTSTAHTHTTLS